MPSVSSCTKCDLVLDDTSRRRRFGEVIAPLLHGAADTSFPEAESIPESDFFNHASGSAVVCFDENVQLRQIGAVRIVDHSSQCPLVVAASAEIRMGVKVEQHSRRRRQRERLFNFIEKAFCLVLRDPAPMNEPVILYGRVRVLSLLETGEGGSEKTLGILRSLCWLKGEQITDRITPDGFVGRSPSIGRQR